MDWLRSGVRLFAARIFVNLLGFVGLAIFTRELTAAQLGIFFLFRSTLKMLTLPADLGFRDGLEKRLSGNQHDPDVLLGSSVVAKLVPISLASILIYAFREPIDGYLGADIALLLILAMVLMELKELLLATLRGELRVQRTAALEFGEQLLFVTVGVLLVRRGFGVDGLVYSHILSMFVISILGILLIDTFVARPELDVIRSLFDYSKYSVVSSIGGFVFSWMDVIIIGYFLTKADVGYYNVAWSLAGIAILFSRSITTATFPQLSNWDLSTESGRSKIEDLTSRSIVPLLVLIVPAFFGSWVLAEELLRVVFGAGYEVAKWILIIHVGGKGLQAMHMHFARVLRAIDRPELAAVGSVVAITSNLVLNVLLVVYIGVVGAAIATVLSFAINWSVNAFFLRRYIQIRFPTREIGWCVVSAAVMAALLVFVRDAIAVDSFVRLFGVVLLGALLYVSIVSGSSNVRVEIRRMVSSLGPS